jgi:hypothetical protein
VWGLFSHGRSVPSRVVIPHDHAVYNFGSERGAHKLNFKVKARISRSDAESIRQALDKLAAKSSVRKEGDEFIVEAEMERASAKELNRTLLSALRKVNKRTTLRAEWTSGDTTEGYFDYVLKKTSSG